MEKWNNIWQTNKKGVKLKWGRRMSDRRPFLVKKAGDVGITRTPTKLNINI